MSGWFQKCGVPFWVPIIRIITFWVYIGSPYLGTFISQTGGEEEASCSTSSQHTCCTDPWFSSSRTKPLHRISIWQRSHCSPQFRLLLTRHVRSARGGLLLLLAQPSRWNFIRIPLLGASNALRRQTSLISSELLKSKLPLSTLMTPIKVLHIILLYIFSFRNLDYGSPVDKGTNMLLSTLWVQG